MGICGRLPDAMRAMVLTRDTVLLAGLGAFFYVAVMPPCFNWERSWVSSDRDDLDL